MTRLARFVLNAAAMRFQQRGALTCGTVGGVIEREAHHRRVRGQTVRRGAEMPGQPIAPISLINPFMSTNGTFQFSLSNTSGTNFSVFSTTDISTPFTNWIKSAEAFAASDALAVADRKSYLRALLYPARFVASVRVMTRRDVNVEELTKRDEPTTIPDTPTAP